MGKSILESMMPTQQVYQEPVQQGPISGAAQFANPIQKMQYVMKAMTNPAAFLKDRFPDIPNEIMNDPNRVMRYLQQTRGISDEQLKETMNQIPRF